MLVSSRRLRRCRRSVRAAVQQLPGSRLAKEASVCVCVSLCGGLVAVADMAELKSGPRWSRAEYSRQLLSSVLLPKSWPARAVDDNSSLRVSLLWCRNTVPWPLALTLNTQAARRVSAVTLSLLLGESLVGLGMGTHSLTHPTEDRPHCNCAQPDPSGQQPPSSAFQGAAASGPPPPPSRRRSTDTSFVPERRSCSKRRA